MSSAVIHSRALSRIKHIHKLSQRYNAHLHQEHTPKLIDLIQEHSKEIRELHTRNDPHCITETGDLIMLCFELLIDMSASVDEVMNHCFERYDTKLSKLLQEMDK